MGFGIAVDSSTNVYATGSTTSPNFNTTNALFKSLNGSATDAFVIEFGSTGTTVAFSTYFGGTGSEDLLTGAIAVDTAATPNIYITGDTNSSSGFPTKSAVQGSFGGGADAFVAKITP